MYHLYMKQWTSEEIKEFRKKLNLYQMDLAMMLGVTERYIIYLEKGTKKPSNTVRLFLDCLEQKLKMKGVKKGHGNRHLQKR